MELEFNEEQNDSNVIETKKYSIVFNVDDENKNKNNNENNINIIRSDSFNCDMSKHIFNPDKGSPDSKFLINARTRLEKY